MKGIHALCILPLIALVMIAALTGCETTRPKAAEPVAVVAEVPQPPPALEPKTEPKPAAKPEPAPAPRAKAPEGPFFVHVVKWRGESLSSVAAWYTGTIQNWRTLAELNPQLTDAKKVVAGTRVRIPERMLITREPMPQLFAESYAKPVK